jgi:predicted MFS family arabinose efflux permease
MLRNVTGYRDLARNHDFTLLWIGQTISELGSRMSMFVLPLLGYHLTHSAVLAALPAAAYLLGMSGALLPAGVLADRLHRGRMMRVASASGVVLYATLVLALLADRLTLPHLVAVAFLSGAAAGVFAPAEMAAVRKVVPNGQLATAMSQNQARQHVADLLGGPVGGVLYGVLRWLPFAADVISYAVSFVLLGRIRTDLAAEPAATDRPGPGEDLREGFLFVSRHPFMRVLLVWAPLANLVINAVVFVAILRLLQAGFSPAAIGVTDAAAGICGILGAIAAPAIIDRFPTGRLTVLVGWSFVPLMVPVIFWNHPAVVALSLGAGLLLNPAGNAGIGAYRVAVTPAELQGRVAAASQFVAMSSMPLAPVLGGALLSALGGPAATAALTAAAAAVAMIVTLSRSVRSVPRPDAWTAAADVPAPDAVPA